ncbi:hypothetical protein CH063_06776 [Colletotrichum higginsianum]|uniref:Uncharacterized protein n=2 Tax=Colletotrichum higginsianum TaxID=80884 RepID=H1V3R7_COLHI|nr:hypothetical protein CH63R_07100 [Colletotrichum higginsianum IMI 349063]OBR08335.1 hypothetical protein CH63R_07100 [Colletotrichum higginsianum IMI 349063]TIC96195.1 hypothetical protein CH35J_008943 [Colletotrichum higginsianum]CCF34869.1 hypothetical protein CH063_06776 [Colletotrichum higginsianum]
MVASQNVETDIRVELDDQETCYSLGRVSKRLPKTRKRATSSPGLEQKQRLESRLEKRRDTKRRIRHVSISQVSTDSGYSTLEGEDDVLVTFPSFEHANVSFDEMLQREARLAQYHDAKEDDLGDWDFGGADIDEAFLYWDRHESVVDYDTYADRREIQAIYSDLYPTE